MVSFDLDTRELAEAYDEVSHRQYDHGLQLIADLAIQPGERVLDVGCGTGKLGEHVADIIGNAGEVWGLDPLPLRIDIAQRRARHNYLLQVGVAEDLSRFKDGYFDVVFLNSVFHWLPDKLTALKEAVRVLKSGGRLGISSAAKEQPHQFQHIFDQLMQSGRFGALPDRPTTSPYKIDRRQLQDLLLEVGLECAPPEIRTFTDYFDGLDEVVEFNLASSFGNFLNNLPHERRGEMLRVICSELEQWRTPQGIRLQRHLIFVTAHKR